MATELESTQASQLLAWLEEERKKDKAMLAKLDEQVKSLAAESQQQARHVRELDATLAAAKTTLSRLVQIDRILDEYKAETKALLERREDERKKSDREATRLRALEIEEINRAIAEIKKDLLRLPKMEDEMSARRAEEKRLGDVANQTVLRVETAIKQMDERTRGIPYLEEGRRQDNKRISTLEGDSVEHSKRIESLSAKLDLLEDSLGKFPAKIDAVNERVTTQDAVIEEMRVLDFRRQQQTKAWDEELAKFRAQMTDYGDVMSRLREQAQINQKAAAELATFQETLRQRAAEIAEVERLFEERTKRTLEQAQGENEKRWQRYATHIDERWHHHDRQNAEQVNRLDHLETARDSLMGAIDDLRAKHDDIVHGLLDMSTSLAEVGKSTLPKVSVPPATSPEDGRGIPEAKPRKRK